MLRKIVLILASAALLLPAVGSARTLDEIIKDGTLRVGVNPNFPPMSSYSMSNELEGFDVDIGRLVAESLGVKVEYVTTEAAQRVPFLVSKRIDIALGAMTRTADRAKLITYTVPLHSEAMGVITTGKLGVSNWKELNRKDITLVNMRGNLSVELLKDLLPEPKVLLVDGNADTIRAIAQGRADALVENVDLFRKFLGNYRNVEWTVLDEPIVVSYCGIGVGKGNYALRDYLNVLLFDLHTSGVIDETWQKWYDAPMAVPVPVTPFF